MRLKTKQAIRRESLKVIERTLVECEDCGCVLFKSLAKKGKGEIRRKGIVSGLQVV